MNLLIKDTFSLSLSLNFLHLLIREWCITEWYQPWGKSFATIKWFHLFSPSSYWLPRTAPCRNIVMSFSQSWFQPCASGIQSRFLTCLSLSNPAPTPLSSSSFSSSYSSSYSPLPPSLLPPLSVRVTMATSLCVCFNTGTTNSASKDGLAVEEDDTRWRETTYTSYDHHFLGNH